MAYVVSESEKKQFASTFLLQRMVNRREYFPIWLEGQDKDLEPILEFMLTRDLVEIKDNKYVPTNKGHQSLTRFAERYTDFLKNFDVYCAVDLEEGDFAFNKWFDFEDDSLWENYLNEDRWEDLRVAVAEYKGLNPVEIVFMSFINENRFGNTGQGWQFDLLLGSIWDDILEICNSALSIDDLAYESEDGPVSGDVVIRDIVTQGAEINHWINVEEADESEEDPAYSSWSAPSYAPPPLPRTSNTQQNWRPDFKPVRLKRLDKSVYKKYKDPSYIDPIWKKKLF